MKPTPVHNQYLISVQRPHLWILSVVVALILVAACIFAAYEYGRFIGGFDQAETDTEIALLQNSIVALTAEKEKLLRERAVLTRGQDIDRDASSQVKKTLAEAQAKMLEMKEELTFYRNIVQPRKSKRTVVVKKMALTDMGENTYNYKLILIQDGRNDVAVRGDVELSIEGEQDGKVVRLDLPTLSTKKVSKRQKFGFKYFQNFDGGIRIPDGFKPLSLFVRVLPKSSRVPRVEEVLAWDDLIAGGEQ
ncbi:MAG: hypothetical protein OQL06_04485 [Gammaproteobacteria bacterium]|nr:hypothetical protein [Gammaproteobacteria bacterium]